MPKELTSFLSLILAFLAGSFPTALLMGKAKGVDLRKVGSGNIGATNVFRSLGKGLGVLCLAIDIFKGWLPAIGFSGDLFRPLIFLPQTWTLIVGLAAVAGHAFCPWVGFRGGKGVATSLGAFLAVAPQAISVCFAVGFVLIAITGYVSVASIAGSILLPLMLVVWPESGERSWTVIALATALGVFVIWKHRPNIQRLRTGTENRIFGQRKPATKHEDTKKSQNKP